MPLDSRGLETFSSDLDLDILTSDGCCVGWWSCGKYLFLGQTKHFMQHFTLPILIPWRDAGDQVELQYSARFSPLAQSWWNYHIFMDQTQTGSVSMGQSFKVEILKWCEEGWGDLHVFIQTIVTALTSNSGYSIPHFGCYIEWGHHTVTGNLKLTQKMDTFTS